MPRNSFAHKCEPDRAPSAGDESITFAPIYIRSRFGVSPALARTIAELLTGGGEL